MMAIKRLYKSPLIKENMSEIYDIVEWPEVIFLLYITDQYQRKDPSLKAKYNNRTYKNGSSCGGSNMNFNLITCKGKMYVELILQSYV